MSYKTKTIPGIATWKVYTKPSTLLTIAFWIFSLIGSSNAEPETNAPFAIFMSTQGNDAHSGTSLDEPIATLERAHHILETELSTHPRDAEVRIAPGTYEKQTVLWTFTMPDHTIRFMPLLNDKVRPLFDGQGTKGTWFTLESTDGKMTNIKIEYIGVHDYGCAISLHGDRNSQERGNGGNTIYGCKFTHIGKDATGAIVLMNSWDNLIRNNHFIDIVRKDSQGALHAVYLAHYSSRNKVLANRFERVCGNPIKVRDYSNYNVVNENTFIRCGIDAAFYDAFCNHDVRDDCTKPGPECPSWENQFRSNVLSRNFAGGHLPTFDDKTGTRTVSGCSLPVPDAKWLHTSGNTHDE